MQTKIVTPRHSKYRHLPLIVVTHSEIWCEHSDEISPIVLLPELILSHPSSIIVSHHIGGLVRKLDATLRAVKTWDVRAMQCKRVIYGPDGRPYERIRISVQRFGFGRSGNGDKAVWHFPLDPEDFCPDNSLLTLEELREWGMDVRSWLRDNNIAIRTSAGGIAQQLLRDRRFYPVARRKVPAETNEQAILRGNYYELRASTLIPYERAYLIDQYNAHHNIVLTTPLPDSNHLHAQGYFHGESDRIWIHRGDDRFASMLKQLGMFRAQITLTVPVADHLPAGRYTTTIYSNEIPRILNKGTIHGFIAAWTSPVADLGLPRFARWSLRELRRSDENRRAWQKKTLHAVYGALAARSQFRRVAYRKRHSRNATLAAMPIDGPRSMFLWRTDSHRELEPITTHAIQRAMIELEQTHRSLEMARELNRRGAKVLAIYADAVITLREPGPLPEKWRVKEDLHNLRFFNATHFESDEVSKRPGMPLAMRESRKAVL